MTLVLALALLLAAGLRGRGVAVDIVAGRGFGAFMARFRGHGRAVLRRLRLLATRGSLPGLGTAFGSGALAAIVRFVFGHGQSSLGAVDGTKGGKDLGEAGGAAWRRALELR
ncbi:hypothetical protein GCM10009105_38370 [Dokdonella soli]|uniref:Secreted protein n=1 Tax=Dokdonella soli TaxID=529810 RepID=A0ABP3U8Y7_9GAMM